MIGMSWISGSALAPPAAAAAWGMNTLTYNATNFTTSLVDVNNTGASGFLLYPNFNWPNAGSTPWISGGITSPSHIQISGGLLTLTSNDTGQLEAGLCTATPSGASYKGSAFKPGWYVEVVMAYNPALVNGSASPACFGISLEMFLGTAPTFEEHDVFEAVNISGVATPTITTTEWTATGNHVLFRPSTGIDFSQPTKLATLLVPSSLNGGTGLVQSYWNDVHISSADTSYTASTGSTPAASPSNPNGVFSLFDTLNTLFFVGTGTNWSNQITSLRVWQRQASDRIIQ